MSADEFGGFDLEDVRKKAEAARNKKPEEKKTAQVKQRRQKSIQVPQAPAVIPVSAAPKQSRFSIEYKTTPDFPFWEITGLGLSEQFDFRLFNGVLPEKVSYLQSNREWEKLASEKLRLANRNLRKHEYLPASMLLHYELFRSLYKNKDGAFNKPVDDIKKFVSKELSDNWVSTLTRIGYKAQPGMLDEIIHTNTLTDLQSEYYENIGAPDCVIDGKCSQSDRNACKGLLGATNTQEVYDVFKWLTGCEPVLQRHPSKVGLDKTAYLMMHTEKGKMRILAMATPETSGTAFGFYRIKTT
jgi:hypothetical protein